MLNQMEFKLRVEKEYMQGIEKMAKLYQVSVSLFPTCRLLKHASQVEGDKRARADAEAKRIESKGKKDLLEAALKRYKTLDIMGGMFDEDDGMQDASPESSCVLNVTAKRRTMMRRVWLVSQYPVLSKLW